MYCNEEFRDAVGILLTQGVEHRRTVAGAGKPHLLSQKIAY